MLAGDLLILVRHGVDNILIANEIAEETKAVGEYRAGKEAALQYLIGKSMKATKGAGNPATLKDLIVAELG